MGCSTPSVIVLDLRDLILHVWIVDYVGVSSWLTLVWCRHGIGQHSIPFTTGNFMTF